MINDGKPLTPLQALRFFTNIKNRIERKHEISLSVESFDNRLELRHRGEPIIKYIFPNPEQTPTE